MPDLVAIGSAFGVAYVTSVIAIPPITRLAVSKRLLDFPDGNRHVHTKAVPRLGGVAVFAGLVIVLMIGAIVSLAFPDLAPRTPRLAGALITASVGLFLVGLADDLFRVGPILKLVAQTIAALLVYNAGFRVEILSFPPHFHIALGWLSLPLTLLWLVGVSNAFNLIDGLDGLAAGVAIIALLAITATTLILGTPGVLLYSVALLGGLVGFLRFNFHPAKIFLGDSGSLVVGFLLAVLSVKGATGAGGVLYALMPIFSLSYLLLDTGIAILRRWLRGTPLSRADSRHIHHQLRAIGLSPRRAVSVVYIQSFIAAALGLCVTFTPPAVTLAVTAAAGVMLMFIMVYGVRLLDYHEFVVAQSSVASVARNARTVIQDKINARDVTMVIRSATNVDEVNTVIGDSAAKFRFAHMQLCPGAATDQLPKHIADQLTSAKLWRLEYPIAQADRTASTSLVLSICCSTTASKRPAGAERIAQILAPAIASWVALKGANALAEVQRELEIVRPASKVANGRNEPRVRMPEGAWPGFSDKTPPTQAWVD